MRLSTTTETGKRVYLYPKAISGFWQKRRSWASSFLVFIFLAIPWIRIQGRPILLLDVIHRKFNVFGLQFWATDVPLVVLVFLIFAIGIALITSILGRAWCGWSCPQTVYIDVIYRRVERWIEGDSIAQKRLDAGPISFDRIFKKSVKWAAFILISWTISHSFLAYFIGSDQVLKLLKHSPSENWGTFQAVWFFTAIVAFDFGWFREQFCIIMCPYGRFQSVMMDQDSLIVHYDGKRGDCIDCRKCVAVCPTGIDIRQGVQLECIACTACIDACDSVMTKIQKPTGLIRFDTESGIQNRKIFRARTYVYGAILLALFSALIFFITIRKNVEVTLLRAHDDPYRMIDEPLPSVLNHFKLKVRNRRFEPLQISFRSHDPQVTITTPIRDLILQESEEREFEFFVRFPRSFLSEGRAQTRIQIESTLQGKTEVSGEEVMLIGPF